MNKDLPKLLRAIASGADARASKHDIIFNAAADEIERLREVTYLQGDGGWFAISIGCPKFCFWKPTLGEVKALAERAATL